jgi:hypothetical protein
MDEIRRQRLVERVWLLEQLRAEARTQADRASTDARRARAAARDAEREATDLRERIAYLGEQLADIHDQLGNTSTTARERADARAQDSEPATSRSRPAG